MTRTLLPFLLSLGVLAPISYAHAAAGQGPMRVTASALNVRSGPGGNYSVITTIARGQVYPALEWRGSYLKLQIGARTGWAHGTYLARTTTPLFRVTASALNVRSGAGSQYRVLGRLGNGVCVAVRGSSGPWRNFNYEGGSAWVHSSYLRSVTAAPSTPSNPAPSRRRSAAGYIQLASSGTGFYSYGQAYKRWGTPRLVYAIERTGRSWNQIRRTRFGVGNISLQNGGYMAPHSSHRRGVDVDIIPQRNDGRENGITIHQGAYSRYWTQRLIDSFRAQISTRVILFNDSRVRGVVYWAGHDNHFHASVN